MHLQEARWSGTLSESVAISFSREKRSLPVSEREGSGGHLGLPLANGGASPHKKKGLGALPNFMRTLVFLLGPERNMVIRHNHLIHKDL